MRRLFWVALGATAGVLVVRRATRIADSWSPGGLAEALGTAVDRLALMWEDVRDAMADRERELRDALELDGRHDVVDAHTAAAERP